VLSKNAIDFIDDAKLGALATAPRPAPEKVRDILAKSLAKEPLQVEETAALIAADQPAMIEEIYATAHRLKQEVYGNRIVIFAPLYIGNFCINDCQYCAFRKSLRSTVRKTLTENELLAEVEALEDSGHKRLILVFGEHPNYTPEYIADTVRRVYAIHKGNGEIRRVNINAAPLDHEGFRTVKASGIGTYQIFQETYHHDTYLKWHPAGTHKADYLWRLDGLSRAYEGGCDDVGIGALFGLHDWRFEVLGLVTHALHLQERYGVGPHTISFPRLRPAHGADLATGNLVSDADFKRLVAILRLSVPYTGMILTARETPEMRREVMAFGVSQIDAGTRIELAGYAKGGDGQELRREQFQIGDMRSLDEIARELLDTGYIPSFCTSCYRRGRTGQQFMEFAIPGFIQRLCTPNALLTLQEYLLDYASPETRAAGDRAIAKALAEIVDPEQRERVAKSLADMRENGKRDICF
jgi:2-iminoacetate synthase